MYCIILLLRKVRKHFERQRCRWEDNEVDFQEMGWEGVNWIYVACGMNQWWAVVYGNEPLGFIN
jgi:hypothetical protein